MIQQKMNFLHDSMASNSSDMLTEEKNCLKLQYNQTVKELLS